jgi:peptidoglycan/xylan/chitin deacetylase (PgdA/CDA1 family)
VVGKWVEKYPQLLMQIVNEGHEIGNHSYSHPNLTKLNISKIKEKILRCDNIIKNITGMVTCPLFRPPYGAGNVIVQKTAKKIGFIYCIYWSIDTLDWQQPTAGTIVDRIIKEVKNGDIILMHNNGYETAAACNIAIPELKKRGYKFVTVGEMLQL